MRVFSLRFFCIILVLILMFGVSDMNVSASVAPDTTIHKEDSNRYSVVYVDPDNGSDWNHGDSPGKAKAHIENALKFVKENGTVILMNGTYRTWEDVWWEWPKNQLSIHHNVKIIGENPEKCILDMDFTYHMVWIGKDCQVCIENMTIESDSENPLFEVDGNLTAKNCIFRGGIQNYRDTLNLSNCTFKNAKNEPFILNSRSSYAKDSDAVTCIINNCTFLNCDNFGVEGLYSCITNYNECYINDSTFKSNKASFGGAIINKGTICDITNCSFIDNRGMFGGAIQNEGQCTIDHCQYTGNNALGDIKHEKLGGIGGAILNGNPDRVSNSPNSKLIVKNSYFTNNTAKNLPLAPGYGGAIATQGSLISEINNCTFINNMAYHGAALSVRNEATCYLYNNKFHNNKGENKPIYQDQSILVSGKNTNYNIFPYHFPHFKFEDILHMGTITRKYIEEHNQTPENININDETLNMAQFLDLATQQIVKIKNKDNSSLEVRNLSLPTHTQDNIHYGHISKDQIFIIAEDTQKYITKYKQAPSYTDKSDLGKRLGFYNLVYIYSIILDKIHTNPQLQDFNLYFNHTIQK